MIKRFFTLEYWQDDNWFVGKIREVSQVFSAKAKPWLN